MPHILNIETATTVCSVALSANGAVLFERVSYEGPSHASLLGLYVEEALAFAKTNHIKLDAVAVSSGPGSYTGLRIGVSLAKGLCFGLDIPLIAVPTLRIMAAQAIGLKGDINAVYCAMIDARRMEVYAAFFNAKLEQVRETAADIIDEDSYQDLLADKQIYFFGSGADKCKSVLTAANASFIDDIHPLASAMVILAEEAFHSNQFEDVAYYEPFYLKEFQATTPKNKVLG